MNAPVERVDIHHEGGGVPRNNAGLRPYSYEIGVGGNWTRVQSPWTSWATLNYNHVSCDIVLTGQRQPGIPGSPSFPVTADDIRAIGECCADARARGELVDAPAVVPHRISYGSTTICPGDNTDAPRPPKFPHGNALVWLGIVNACHKETPPMPPQVSPQFFPAIGPFVSWCIFNHPTLGRCAVAVDDVGHVFCDPPEAYMGSPYDDHTHQAKTYWAARHAAKVLPAASVGRGAVGYVIEDTDGNEGPYGPQF